MYVVHLLPESSRTRVFRVTLNMGRPVLCGVVGRRDSVLGGVRDTKRYPRRISRHRLLNDPCTTHYKATASGNAHVCQFHDDTTTTMRTRRT